MQENNAPVAAKKLGVANYQWATVHRRVRWAEEVKGIREVLGIECIKFIFL